MSYDATCYCPKCGYKDIEIDEIDIYSMEDDVLED